MLSLTRRGVTDRLNGAESFGLLDDLDMGYTGNRLTSLSASTEALPFEGVRGVARNDDFTLTYNTAGDLLSDPSRGLVSTEWNSQGFPTEFVFDDGTSQRLVYDGLGNHISTEFVRPVAALVGVDDENGATEIVTKRRYTGAGYVIGTAATGRDSVEMLRFDEGYFDSSDSVNYYIADYLGANIAVVSASGALVQQTSYYPYGEPHRDPWTIPATSAYSTAANSRTVNPYLYTGKELYPQSRLYDYGARHYDSRLGRWLSQDPLQTRSMNYSSYVFCLLNPIAFVDIDGNREWPVNSYNGKPYRHGNNYMQKRGKRSNGSIRYHLGVDINIGYGDDDFGAPVYATHAGRVVRVRKFTEDKDDGGTRIKIQSADGKVATYYMHLNTISPGIELNAQVSEGQQIGTIGKSAKGKKDGTASHLHYELFVDGERADPTNGKDHLVNPQLIIESQDEDALYQGGELPEVTVPGPLPQKEKTPLIPVNPVTPPTELPNKLHDE